MASSSSSSAPVFSSRSWKYDVFLSFRGEDTRRTFVDHLYAALERQGINTYKDDVTLPRGETIGPSLLKAIEESQIALIIFSEHYADSSWCLDELAHIMKCRDKIRQIAMPIFYDVDPSEVRKQKRKYGKAFAKHELENKLKVESWRKALVDASNISGWETRNIANGHEAEGIKQIVVEISHKLQPVTSSTNDNLPGLEARVEVLKSLLEIGSAGVRMIGIWGVGGGGKATIASSVYDEICRQFDGCCYVQNIREESSRYGLRKLQEQIISEMGANKVGGGRCMIKDSLSHRKVLIVLEDVDQLDQLEALTGSRDWFGDGSRIIITCRDQHLLWAHRVNVIHQISLLNDDEAIKLFCKHAPRDNRPMEDYEQLSKEVVSYAGGLPLALTVLGSFLCDKDISEWKSALERLKQIPHEDIQGKIKINFDGLQPVEKDLFLDIACFFRRVDKDQAMGILDACGFHPVIGVKVLIQKALITISNGKFDMHNLVQELGRNIVTGGHYQNPEKHSRVWRRKDILEICSMDATTNFDMIEAIRYKCKKGDPIHLPPIAGNMKNLRWIEWEGDLASPMLSNFPLRKLCCLILHNSLQKQLWEGYKLLPNLKIMELRYLKSLIRTPDFDGLPNLERFMLKGCWYLEEIHPSIVRLENLVFLSVNNCPCLKMFPPITRLKKLETFILSDCLELFKLAEIQQKMNILPHLSVDYSENKRCLEEPSLPHNSMKPALHDNMNHIGLQFFFKDLRELDLSFCSLGDEEMGSAVWELPNLKTLHLSENEFSRLSFSHLRFPRLKLLNVSSCYNLVELSELPSSIAVVIADGCHSLESFGDILNCKWLWNVSLQVWEKNKLDCDRLLDSMLQGNASEDYFINILLERPIPESFLARMFRRRTFTLRLPDDWCNNFCGFLICVITKNYLCINIVIKKEVDEDSLSKLWQESNEAVEPEYDGRMTCVGYVSFGSLRHTTFFNSLYTMISVSLDCMSWNSLEGESLVGAELVPRKVKGDQPQTTKLPTTDSAEFRDEDLYYRPPPFMIQEDSKSSIKIVWRPKDNRL